MNWRTWWPFNVGGKRREEREKRLDELINSNIRYADALMVVGKRSLGELTIIEFIHLLETWIMIASNLDPGDPEGNKIKARIIEGLIKSHPAWQASPDT